MTVWLVFDVMSGHHVGDHAYATEEAAQADCDRRNASRAAEFNAVAERAGRVIVGRPRPYEARGFEVLGDVT